MTLYVCQSLEILKVGGINIWIQRTNFWTMVKYIRKYLGIFTFFTCYGMNMSKLMCL